MSLPLPESELRGLIREVLRELVRDEVARALADLQAGDTVIVLGRGAVATPLAKDRARRLGIRIEKDNEEN